jgi:hypoxanthine phosphoribosyltransferase
VEDIVDTEITIDLLRLLLEKRNPASLKTLSLLSKPSRREIEVPIEYIGFEIENKWVIGYGFDTDGWGRGMNEIHEKTGE